MPNILALVGVYYIFVYIPGQIITGIKTNLIKNRIASYYWRTKDSIFYRINRCRKNCSLIEIDSYKEDEIRYAAGLKDYIDRFSPDNDNTSQKVETYISLIKEVAKNGNRDTGLKIYQMLINEENIISIIAKFVGEYEKDYIETSSYLKKFIKDLMLYSKHKNAIKFGLCLTAFIKENIYEKYTMKLALHDEFSFHCIIALMNSSQNPFERIFKVAKKVNGWGRVQAIEKLAFYIDNAQHLSWFTKKRVENWLLYEGYKNSITNSETSLLCASYGKLAKKISKEKTNTKLLKACFDMIDGMLYRNNINDCKEADIIIENFLKKTTEYNFYNLPLFVIVNKINNFLLDKYENPNKEGVCIFTTECTKKCFKYISKIINSYDWKAETISSLKNCSQEGFYIACESANILEIDYWDYAWERLQQNPENYSIWLQAMPLVKKNNINKVLDFAEKNIPLETISTGPEMKNGIGEIYNHHNIVAKIVFHLENHPNKGKKFIFSSLKSPVLRNRYTAINTLDKWDRKHWDIEIYKALEGQLLIEPDDEIKSQIELMLGYKQEIIH